MTGRDMVWVPSGRFRMGSDAFYPEERPVRAVDVAGFWIDDHPVTVAEFDAFVSVTGHVTVAERAPAAADFPGADPALLVPGSLVFTRPPGPVPLDDFRNWWSWVPGADWRHPTGPDSDVSELAAHPVTHIAYDDALAFAAWAGKALPNEAEWEYAARGGLDGATYAWGDEETPGGQRQANTWQGRFPWENTLDDGFERTSPVKHYPANGYGLYDMTGNVWEWTVDAYGTAAASSAEHACCGPTVASAHPVLDYKVIKGGSHLCAPSYCLRYRPAARQPESTDSSTSHLGFRCVVRPSS